ncbi:hypothetical protein D3C86_2097780 [compost metagenome]
MLLGQAVDFLAWLAVGQVALVCAQVGVFSGKAVQAFTGLFELLLLQHRQVHGYVAAKRHGHGFDYMHHG